jgi:hypothetical protein
VSSEPAAGATSAVESLFESLSRTPEGRSALGTPDNLPKNLHVEEAEAACYIEIPIWKSPSPRLNLVQDRCQAPSPQVRRQQVRRQQVR